MKTKALVAFFVASAILMSCKSVSSSNNTGPWFGHPSKQAPLSAAAAPAPVDAECCATKEDGQSAQPSPSSKVYRAWTMAALTGLVVAGFAVLVFKNKSKQ